MLFLIKRKLFKGCAIGMTGAIILSWCINTTAPVWGRGAPVGGRAAPVAARLVDGVGYKKQNDISISLIFIYDYSEKENL